ncbi:hypothetical protein J4P02_21200 [Pseudomonas sp. NFXW11]|uniref:hypothetical protein n=1 Tax=Pseudomonas sp. NFXW11 TaxID=2819531 RepID=UPI003CEA35FF
MSAGGYPRLKVFMAFILCPLVPGLIAGLVQVGLLLAHLASNPRLLGEVRGAEIMLMPLLAPVVAVLVFLLPLFCLALAVALIGVRRSVFSCRALGLIGGVVAISWVMLFIRAVVNDIATASYGDYLPGVVLLFVAATLTCWATARFFLPAAEPEIGAMAGAALE